MKFDLMSFAAGFCSFVTLVLMGKFYGAAAVAVILVFHLGVLLRRYS